jgi:hypothetical protein
LKTIYHDHLALQAPKSNFSSLFKFHEIYYRNGSRFYLVHCKTAKPREADLGIFHR